MRIVLSSISETKKFAREFLFNLIKKNRQRPLIIALEGSLGSGKTTFTRLIGEVLGIKENISSPTFVLMHTHIITNTKKSIQKNQREIISPLDKKNKKRSKIQDLIKKSGYKKLIHIDCYRVETNDIINLGFKDIVKDKKNIVIVEWANKIKKIVPKNAIWLKFKIIDENTRTVFLQRDLNIKL